MFTTFINTLLSKKNFYFLLLLIAIIWFFCKNMDIAFMIFVSLIFACALMPSVDKLSQKVSRPMAATVVVSGLVFVCCVCLIPIITLSIEQLKEFANSFPTYLDNLDDTLVGSSLFKALGISEIKAEDIMAAFSSSSSDIINNAINFTKEIGAVSLYIFTSIILLFFFLTDKDLVKENLLNIFPSEIRKKTKELFESISSKLGGYAVAQTVVSGSVWITMTIGLMLIKVEYAVILGIIAGVLSLIPVVGSAFSLIICLIATYESGLTTLILITILFTLSHFFENQVVRPYVYSKMLNLHPIIIFLSLFIGGKYAGFMGMLLAPPLAMAMCIIFDELYIKKMD